MKRVTLFYLAMVLVFGSTIVFVNCSKNAIDLGAPELPADLCMEHDATKSVLLKVAEERGIPLNEVYYGLIDGVAIGMLLPDGLDRVKVQEFMNDLSTWYNDNYPVSYTTLIEYMTSMENARQLTGILSRRIGAFRSHLYISKYDDCLLRAGWSSAMDELYLR